MRIVPEIVVRSGQALLGADAAEQARECVRSGADLVLLRDIGSGGAAVAEWLERFIEAAGVPVHLDCTGMDPRRIELFASLRLGGVVLDARAISEPLLLRWALDVLGSRLSVELQGDGPYLFDAPRGYDHLTLAEAAELLGHQGVPRVIYRDMTGDRLPRLHLPAISRALRGELWIAEAVRDLPDLEELVELGLPNVTGVVVGRPIFDGRLRLDRAIAYVDSERGHRAA